MAMFEQPTKSEGQETVIGPGVYLTGDLKAGEIIIKGKIKGQITSKNSVLIEEGAEVEGSIEGVNITIDGTVKGNIVSHEDLEINPAGKIYGDIITKSLIIKKGAIFVGKCNQSSAENTEKEKEAVKK